MTLLIRYVKKATVYRLNRQMVLGSLGVIAASCTHQRTSVDNQPSRISLPVEFSDSVTPTHSIAALFSPGRLTYDYRSITMIQALAESTPRTDSIQVTAVLSTTFQDLSPQQSIRVISRIDSVVVQPLVSNAQSPSIVQPGNHLATEEKTFEIERLTGHVRQSIDKPACTQNSRESLLRGDEVLPTVPIQSVSRHVWTDTLTRQLCRGGVLFSITHIPRYELEASTNASESRLLRETESQLAGTGIQWQQPVEANGRMVGTDTFFISTSTNRIQRVVGYTRSEISFQSARQNQQFLQTTTTDIQLRR